MFLQWSRSDGRTPTDGPPLWAGMFILGEADDVYNIEEEGIELGSVSWGVSFQKEGGAILTKFDFDI